MDALHDKEMRLKTLLLEYGSLAVAFSGGIDSTFLLYMAQQVLGARALAVTAAPAFVSPGDLEEAAAFCRTRGIRQIVIPSGALQLEEARRNPPDRCYICKMEIFGKIQEAALREGIPWVAEGSNLDDTADYRPGMRAIRERNIISPLLECGFTKAEIRALSKEHGLPAWDRPSSACLASRFVYGEAITDEKLAAVDRAEQLLKALGFRQCRVRVHGSLARIEVLPAEVQRLAERDLREKLLKELRTYGFRYVTLDLAGYRTGSMNEELMLQ